MKLYHSHEFNAVETARACFTYGASEVWGLFSARAVLSSFSEFFSVNSSSESRVALLFFAEFCSVLLPCALTITWEQAQVLARRLISFNPFLH